jgi:NAD kinase
MGVDLQRVVVVSRSTEYERVLARHGTHQQAELFLAQRGQSVSELRTRHEVIQDALHVIAGATPNEWRRATVRREDLATFLFEPADLVVVVGQDGLVANVAKYLRSQLVIGVNPDPSRYDGVLVQHSPAAAASLMRPAAAGRVEVDHRTMVEALLDDGQRLVALNEVFVGVRSHQSARYILRIGTSEDRQSSSGLIVASGTGATGWARSIHRERRSSVVLPEPFEQALAFFVREAFPSITSGTELTEGRFGPGDVLEVESENEVGGVVFGDGNESDAMVMDWSQRLRVTVADEKLRLVAA